MNENYFADEGAYSFFRHSSMLEANRPTLLFLHGIGDSSLSFIPFLESPKLQNYNIVIPDLLGYGKSSKNSAYGFARQTRVLAQHLHALEKTWKINFNPLILIPHSMGAIIAMLLYASTLKNQIKGMMNVEGTITQYGSFISEAVSDVSQKGKFASWFQNFKEETVFNKLLPQFPFLRSYYASLRFCDEKAFLQNALEMRQLCLASSGKYTNIIGKEFAELNLPKVYCYGDQSLCQESVNFLHENHLATQVFHAKNHFVMLECIDEFIDYLVEWLIKNL